MPINTTAKTNELVLRWMRAKRSVELAKSNLNSADCELRNAECELGKWLVPEGQNDEAFNIWFGSGILQSVRRSNGDHQVSWRKEPDGKDRLEFGV